jgi:hypothetical protein
MKLLHCVTQQIGLQLGPKKGEGGSKTITCKKQGIGEINNKFQGVFELIRDEAAKV